MHRRQDRFHHTADALQHIVAPETQDAIALCSKISGPLFISSNVLRLIVLRSVDLDDEPPFVAGEVCEVRTDGGLPSEMRVLNGEASQMPPEFAFGIGHIASESTGARNARIGFFWSLTSSHARPPPLPPSPSPPLARARGGRGAAPLCVPYIESKAAVSLNTSPVHLADLAHRVLDPLGVGVPERLEFRLVEIGEVLAEILERIRERLAIRGRFDIVAQMCSGRVRRAL